MIERTVLLMVAGLVTLTTPCQGDEPKKHQVELQGTWVLQIVRVTGMEEIPIKNEDLKGALGDEWKDLRLTFEGDNVSIRSRARPEPRRVPYTLDPKQAPKQIDFDGRLNLGRNRKEYIYKVDGDKLVLAFAFGEVVGGGSFEEVRRVTLRPRDFIATRETAAPVVMTFRRVQP